MVRIQSNQPFSLGIFSWVSVWFPHWSWMESTHMDCKIGLFCFHYQTNHNYSQNLNHWTILIGFVYAHFLLSAMVTECTLRHWSNQDNYMLSLSTLVKGVSSWFILCPECRSCLKRSKKIFLLEALQWPLQPSDTHKCSILLVVEFLTAHRYR